jgi:hypothetical protein
MPQPPTSHLAPDDIEAIRRVVGLELLDVADWIGPIVRGELLDLETGKSRGVWPILTRVSLIGGIAFGTFTVARLLPYPQIFAFITYLWHTDRLLLLSAALTISLFILFGLSRLIVLIRNVRQLKRLTTIQMGFADTLVARDPTLELGWVIKAQILWRAGRVEEAREADETARRVRRERLWNESSPPREH